MKKEITLIQAKRLVQIANGQENCTLEQYEERDAFIHTIQALPSYAEAESKVSVIADGYQKELKERYDEWMKGKESARQLKKGARNKKESELDIEYTKAINLIKRRLNEEVAKLDEDNWDKIVGEVNIPDWLKIPSEEYFRFFKKH